MKLKKLKLSAFRNISEAEIEFQSDLNFIIGLNGQGKTSVLEAIKVLSRLESFKSNQIKDLIQYGKSSSVLSAELVHSENETQWSEELRVLISTTDLGKSTVQVWINGKPSKSKLEYLKELSSPHRLGFYAISFNPADHEIIDGDPKLRRNYLNEVISAEDLGYYAQLKKYNALIEQRNKLLKQFSEGTIQTDLLDSFPDPLVALSATIVSRRVKHLNRMLPVLNQKLGEISGNRQLPVFIELTLGGMSDTKILVYGAPLSWDEDQYRKNLLDSFRRMRNAELRVQSTLMGAHRDQWSFRTDFAVLKGRASQGEVRSVLLAMKLAEIENYQLTTRIKPILLLDDFSSELDSERRQFLLSYLQSSRLQAFVTTTENPHGVPSSWKVFEGKIQALKT